MRRAARTIGTILLFTIVFLCLATVLAPPFLDRIYYRGPVSDHFDGERFFNPEGEAGDPRRSPGFFLRFLAGRGRSPWPEMVPVTPARPPRRVEGSAMQVTWVGHATMLVQTGGLNILTDPVWSDRASPFSFTGPRRVRAPGIGFDDLPPIDLVLVSHNHYDHLDTATLRRLWDRDRPLIVTGLGNDRLLADHGVTARGIDWNQRVMLPAGGSVRLLRNHHWSSRWFADRNRALWGAFAVELPGGNIFFGGDTGWGDGSWVREAAARGPYRLAIIPIGAYEPRDFMQHHHIDPAEAVRIFETLRPAKAVGVHWGTFQLTFEPINDPPRRLEALKRARGIAPDRFVAPEAGRPISVPVQAPVRAGSVR